MIFYSLGNFAFDKGKGIQDPKTICACISLEKIKVNYKVLYTEFTPEGVKICNDEFFKDSIDKKCKILRSDEYIKMINANIMTAFSTQYINYYDHIFNRYTGNIKQLLNTIYFRGIKREKISDLWLYHNTCIETHNWICRRAADLRRNGYYK